MAVITELISAREAMQRALMTAENEQFEHARFWLDFARELREEAQARQAYEAVWKPKTPPAPDPGVLAGTERPREYPHFGMPTMTADTVISVPLERPGEAIEGAGNRCRHCGYFLKLVSPLNGERDPQWVHTRTGQAVCPVGRATGFGADDTVVHTFAEPE
jgi:hypothetical protein